MIFITPAAVYPRETNNYTITGTRDEVRVSDSVTVSVVDPGAPPSATLAATQGSIVRGKSALLTWSSTNADAVLLDNGIGVVPPAGSLPVFPVETSTYTATASNENGSASASVTITVTVPPPRVELSAGPSKILAGESAVLSWTSADATSCAIAPGIGEVDINGSATVSPASTTVYAITAEGPGGTASDSVAVIVGAAAMQITFHADPDIIAPGESSTLSWTTSHAKTVSIDPGIGSAAADGSQTVSPDRTTVYTLTASGPGGTVLATAAVTVETQRQPQPEGSFGSRYEDLIPADAADTEYEPRRFSLIAGKVLAVEGHPLENAEISIRGHAEYGTVFTDGDGEFAIPAEGGSIMTVSYRIPGRIPAHRKVNVPWNEVAIAGTVHLVAEDAAATGVVFDGDPATTVVHRATPVADEFGTRSLTMVFSGDNQAYETDESGDVVAVLDSVVVRATEFSTPESMPA